MKTISTTYLQKRLKPSDISEHLPYLKKYGLECEHITEMGVRKVTSTWAFLAARPKKLVCIDWDHPIFPLDREEFAEAKRLAEEANIILELIIADSTKVQIEETDLLFIDSWHTYEQILLELFLHSDKVKKYILAHDTNETIFPGMTHAINDFIGLNSQWKVEKVVDIFPDLTILKRVDNSRTDCGTFDKDNLMAEIILQRKLYYENCTEGSGPMGDGWHEYVENQKKRFALRKRNF